MLFPIHVLETNVDVFEMPILTKEYMDSMNFYKSFNGTFQIIIKKSIEFPQIIKNSDQECNTLVLA